MKGVIVVNGYYKGESYSHQVKRIRDELIIRGVAVDVYENNKPVEICDRFDYDFGVFLDKDVLLARTMENSGVLLFNNSFAIENADDKVRTDSVLAKYGDAVFPKTVFSPKKYFKGVDEAFLKSVADRLGYPIVVKTNCGSLGTGVYLAKNFDSLVKTDAMLVDHDRFYQQFVSESEGKSVRIIVIGDKVVAAMSLSNATDFRSNANLGGVAQKYEISKDYANIAVKIAEQLDLDYCGIDFFACAPILIEVNSNAFFKAMESVSGVNIAGAYADYIIKKTEENL